MRSSTRAMPSSSSRQGMITVMEKSLYMPAALQRRAVRRLQFGNHDVPSPGLLDYLAGLPSYRDRSCGIVAQRIDGGSKLGSVARQKQLAAIGAAQALRAERCRDY